MFTISRHWIQSSARLNQCKHSHTITIKINLNIILPSTLRSSMLCFLFKYFDWNCTYTHFSSQQCMLHEQSISFSLISSTWWYFVNSTNYGAPHYVFVHVPITFSFLGPNILLSTLFWNTLNLSETPKFHTT